MAATEPAVACSVPPGVSWRALSLGIVSGITVSGGALVLLVVGALTLFRARRLYAGIARRLSLAVLAVYGVRFVVHQGSPAAVLPSKGGSYVPRRGVSSRVVPPPGQVVYISNHTSTLDLFLLVALGLPNTRFFLSGVLRKFVPLWIIAWLMGTFFTVPQDRPAERTRIFQRAERELRRSGESVYLSPEGGRITTGRIGRFNKGAFHLATNLHAPIVPMFFEIPRGMDPGLGYDARPGTVHIHVLPAIDTQNWNVEDLASNIDRVRAVFVRANEELRCA